MPISFQRVLVRLLRRVMRASIFAPFATAFLANSRLVMVPEPSGPGSLSPMPGSRTYTIMCSTVYPS